MYKQLCCWPATTIEGTSEQQFENEMFQLFGVRVKLAEVTLTLPDKTGPGGRSDLLFYIHNDDVQKFALPRLQAGIRWWEDVIKYNDGAHLYNEEILEKYKPTW